MVQKSCEWFQEGHARCCEVLPRILLRREHIKKHHNLVIFATLIHYDLLTSLLQDCHPLTKLEGRTENVPMLALRHHNRG